MTSAIIHPRGRHRAPGRLRAWLRRLYRRVPPGSVTAALIATGAGLATAGVLLTAASLILGAW